MSRTLLALLIALALVFAACGGGASGGSGTPDTIDQTDTGGDPPPDASAPPPDTGMDSGEATLALMVLDLVNDERAVQSLPPLALHAGGSHVAWLHSLDMDLRDFFAHVNPDGMDPGDRIDAGGIVNFGWGENIAYGYPTPEAVMAAWMNSSGHRANILNAAWTHIGIGVHDAPGGPWWTQDFLRIP